MFVLSWTDCFPPPFSPSSIYTTLICSNCCNSLPTGVSGFALTLHLFIYGWQMMVRYHLWCVTVSDAGVSSDLLFCQMKMKRVMGKGMGSGLVLTEQTHRKYQSLDRVTEWSLFRKCSSSVVGKLEFHSVLLSSQLDKSSSSPALGSE